MNRSIKRAAKIYQLALAAHLDTGGCTTELHYEVISHAANDAISKLEKMGINYSDVSTLEKCIEQASHTSK